MTEKSQSQELRKNIMKEDLETDIGNAQKDTAEVKDSNKNTRESRSIKSNVGSNELNSENIQSKNVKKNQRNLRKKTDREGDVVILNDESEKGEVIENNESHKSESKSEKVTHKPKKMLKRKSSSSNNQGPKKFKNNKTKSNAEGDLQLKTDKKNKGKGKKKKIVVNNESEGAGPEEYEVAKLVDINIKKNGEREFLIRWKGYSPKDDTWEPEKHLNCNRLLEAFLKKWEKAKKKPLREMRTNRRKTDRYVVNDGVRGRKSSARLKRKPRKTYYDSN